jgi:protein-serine/threonine kinase
MLESVHSSLIPQPQTLETQSKPSDSDLFTEACRIEPRLPIPSAQYNTNHATVRIYANSLYLSPDGKEQTVHPSVITVERAVLCQVFLETKYHRTFQRPSERQQRRDALESLVSKGTQLNNDQKAKFEQVLKSVESEWSRLSRVRPSIDAFDIENKLGSGGFGVVNMVREKQTGAVYAMKVCPLEALTKSISKDKTLRLGHEGRVLCERDLLKKASESGSIWICKLHYAFQDTQALYISLHAVNEADI